MSNPTPLPGGLFISSGYFATDDVYDVLLRDAGGRPVVTVVFSNPIAAEGLFGATGPRSIQETSDGHHGILFPEILCWDAATTPLLVELLRDVSREYAKENTGWNLQWPISATARLRSRGTK